MLDHIFWEKEIGTKYLEQSCRSHEIYSLFLDLFLLMILFQRVGHVAMPQPLSDFDFKSQQSI